MTVGGPIALDGGGSLTFASNSNIQDLQIGAVPSGGVGSSFSHVVNINGNLTATSLTAQTNSTNIVNIAAGKTLTINGPMTVGFDTSPSTVAPGIRTKSNWRKSGSGHSGGDLECGEQREHRHNHRHRCARCSQPEQFRV